MRNRIVMMLALLVGVVAATAALHTDAQGQQSRRRRPLPRRAAKAAESRPPASAPSSSASLATTTPSGLTIMVTRHGTGRQPQAGETVLVHYTGTLTNGVKFDSSRDRQEPIAFKLGAGRVIKGWDEGIARLRVGDQAVLVIPPQLGYGERGAGGVIPPDATLVFIVELVDVKASSLAELLSQTIMDRGIDAALSQYRELKAKGLDNIYTGESDLNELGYRLLRSGRAREAIEILKLNVEAYPRSANVYDSLAEAYMVTGNRQLAIENYTKALELDPQLESARRALNTLKGN